MHHFISSSKDTVLYSENITQNTGLDEILELEKKVKSSSVIHNSRILIDFDLASISTSIAEGKIGKDHKVYLNLFTAQASQIPLDYTVYGYPLSQSWEMGSGKKLNLALATALTPSGTTTVGASWKYRDGTNTWISSSAEATGGVWLDVSQSSQAFSYEASDIRMDVTNTANEWISGNIPNNGFILKRSPSDESGSTAFGNIQFFSKETHTIFQPKLEIAWDDSSFNTGSLSPVAEDDDVLIYMRSLRPKYKTNAKVKFKILARDRYPQKSYYFTTQSVSVKYLPTSSYYSVEDVLSGQIIVPFGQYSKLSCDSTGNYFYFWMQGLEPERYYRITYKVDRTNTEEIFDNGFEFFVDR